MDLNNGVPKDQLNSEENWREALKKTVRCAMKNKSFPLLLLSILLFGIYFQVLVELVSQWWDDPNYSHGFLIPLVSGYLIWRRRQNLKSIPLKKSNLGLLILIAGLGIYIVGTAAAEYFTVRFSLVVVISGLVLYFGGRQFFKEIWFPLVFLLFMIPIPYVIYYTISFPMQLFSTRLASSVVHLTGIPAVRQGNIIHLPNYSLEVVEACSGLRSLISLSALGAIFAYLTQKTTFSRTLLFLLSIPIAIGANVFRLFVTAIGAVIIGPEFAEGFLHQFSGVVVFIFGLISLIIAGGILRWIGRRRNIGLS